MSESHWTKSADRGVYWIKLIVGELLEHEIEARKDASQRSTVGRDLKRYYQLLAATRARLKLTRAELEAWFGQDVLPQGVADDWLAVAALVDLRELLAAWLDVQDQLRIAEAAYDIRLD